MNEKQIQVLIQIRERLMLQLSMISRLIDYWMDECHGKPNLELLESKEDKEDGESEGD